MTSTSFNLAAAGFGMALAAAIFRSRQQRLFAATLAMAAIASAAITLQHAPLALSSELLERVEMVIGFLVGPVMWLYARQSFDRRSLVHFVPAAVTLAILPPVQLMMLHQFAYTAASASLAFRAERRSAVWLRRMVVFFIGVHVAQLVRLAFRHEPLLRNIVPITLSVGMLYLAFEGFRAAFEAPAPKYRNAPLPAADELAGAFEARMRDERWYLDTSLSLQTLAQRAGMSTHQLSQLLSQQLGTSFYDYVNRFRVDAACARLVDRRYDRITVDALAEESGFPSRSSFYGAFRKLTGMAPTEYRRAKMSEPFGMDKPGESAS